MTIDEETGAVAIAAAVGAGAVSAAEVAADAARRIEAAADLVAVVDFDPDEGRVAAEAVDVRLAAGERLPLAGVPILVKDNLWVAGRRVTQGSRLFADFRPPADAIGIARMRAAGAVVMGMANSSEFACKGMTTNKVYGTTRHPQDPRLTPGGSSGGPASAVAAGLVPVALGTDGGGSSRRPPAHVGAVGYKPSYGAVPRGPGFASPFGGLSCISPIANAVADIRLVMAVLAGPDPRDAESLIALFDGRDGPAAPRIAWSPKLGLDVPVDAAVAEGLETAVAALQAAGLTVERRDPVWPEGLTELSLMPIQFAGLAAIHGEAWMRDPSLFDPDVGRQIEQGLAMDGPTVSRAFLLSQDIRRAVARFFLDVDFLLAPTVPCCAWPNDRLGPETIGGVAVAPRAHAVFTPFFNHAQVPAISLPAGRNGDGLPFGLQVAAARGWDFRLIGFAERIEAVLDVAGLWKAGRPAAPWGRA
ncbi:amidotransferase [Prosthecomicrobium hirschii]|uniref:Amidotransferase n=1 Tax=Prosthecodimorpha hirschii TaxID=665126 RepID=A0A0P6VWE8_9HYPH|nr:amidase [Prosthecomicrobium hirschii]KPL51210.1 amidotransferase [Prosthecomicrobium hirschii]